MDRRSGQGWFAESRHAAILMVDISGFTSLTERFTQQGAAGAEQLSGILNRHFGRMAEITESLGGDIIAFAGDSAIAMWPGEESALRTNVTQAIQAALQIRSELDAYEPDPGITIRHRASVASGQIQVMELGGVHGRWQFVVTGQPIPDASDGLRAAKPGEIVLSPAAWTEVKDLVDVPASQDGPARITAIRTDRPPSPSSNPVPHWPSDESLALLAPCVPRVVSDRLQAGQEGWIAEFRSLTMLFVNLPDGRSGTPSQVASLHQAVCCVQEVLERFEGTLYQFLMDDKGLTAVCAFGLPPLAHENDPRRATEAAITLRERLNSQNLASSTGIATGRVFCGVYGSETRRQYTVLGNTINLAARLMQAANGSIWCDEATRVGASVPSLQFAPMGEISVKGRSAPVSVFAPTLCSDSGAQVSTVAVDIATPIGREAELGLLSQALTRLVNHQEGGCIFIEGEAGIGKSCLLNHFSRQVAAVAEAGDKIACRRAATDPIEQSTPYHVWRGVFRDLLGLSGPPAVQRDQVIAAIAPSHKFLALAPLLNVVLPLDFPETATTAAFEGQARSENTQQLLLELLKDAAKRSPIVVILEDAHWFDASSMRLALLALQQVPGLLLVLSSRPRPEPPPSEFNELLSLPLTLRLVLETLKPDLATQIVCRTLGVSRLPPEVERVIEDRAAGNPLFSEQLAYALRDSGLIEVIDGQCRVTESISGVSLESALSAMSFPHTVEGVITSRLDRMATAEQLTVKVASVIGQSFSLELLTDLYPVTDSRSELPGHLHQLENLDMVARVHGDDQLYAFRHVAVREAAYNAIPFARRRQLHQTVAEWYERHFGASLAPHLPLLAHHWSQTERVEKAVYYCSEAGRQSLRNHANPEAARFFAEALRLDEGVAAANGISPQAKAQRRAEWELQLGKAYVNWSKYVEGREHLERGLSLQRQRVPINKGSTAAALMKEIAVQISHRLMPRQLATRDQPTQGSILESSRVYEALTELYFLQDDPLRCIHAVCRSLNLAESAGPSPELTRAYSSVASLLGFATMHRAAEYYFDRSQRVSQAIDDPASTAWVALARSVYLTGIGQWELAATLLNQAIATSDTIGDRRRGDDARIMLTLVQLYQGKFRESLSLADLLYKSAKERLDIRIQAEALYGKAWNLLLLGRIQELPACIEELDLLRSAQMKIGGWHRKQDVYSLYAVLYASNGDFARAAEHADKALAASHGSFQPNQLLIYSAILEVYLSLLQVARSGAQGGAVQESNAASAEASVSAALKMLRGFSRLFPIGKPLLHLRQGQREWIMGNRAGALKHCKLGLQAARTLPSEYYEGLAHLELASCLEENGPARAQHLHEGEAILSRLGATRDLARLRKEPQAVGAD
ncbi:MAG TPA: AAA family ATPase [Silvibacterium sp.]|nr:AAA family ATPase [Silvibacterium sp.]